MCEEKKGTLMEGIKGMQERQTHCSPGSRLLVNTTHGTPLVRLTEASNPEIVSLEFVTQEQVDVLALAAGWLVG